MWSYHLHMHNNNGITCFVRIQALLCLATDPQVRAIMTQPNQYHSSAAVFLTAVILIHELPLLLPSSAAAQEEALLACVANAGPERCSPLVAADWAIPVLRCALVLGGQDVRRFSRLLGLVALHGHWAP